jgi:hypothetical protein
VTAAARLPRLMGVQRLAKVYVAMVKTSFATRARLPMPSSDARDQKIQAHMDVLRAMIWAFALGIAATGPSRNFLAWSPKELRLFKKELREMVGEVVDSIVSDPELAQHVAVVHPTKVRLVASTPEDR